MDQKRIEEKFECQRCGLCCIQPGFVYLRSGEADRIAEYLKMDIYDFTDRYCEVVDRQRIVLKKRKDEVCVFYDESGKGCDVHPVKPIQCKEFPFKWRTEKSFDYCEGLKKLRKEEGF